MASILKHLRSSTANKRPTASGLSDGQIAINTASGTPALFFKDNADNIVKVGPVHVGATAPNTSPAGSAGNSTGELWVDDGLTTKGLKYYSGTAFVNLTPSGTTSESGLVELATNAETQTGSDAVRAVTPAGLQSKVSDSTSTISSTTIASATAVKSAYDLANAALPKTGGTVTGEIVISPSGSLAFEGSTDDSFETRIVVTDPTADRTITLPNITGTVITTGDTGTVTSTMIADGTIVNADINASAAIAPSKLGSGALPNGVTVSSTNIVDGTIVNADVNASAAIAGSKISPDFAGQNVVTTGSVTGASLIPSSSTVPTNGVYLPSANNVAISTNGQGQLFVDSNGRIGLNIAAPDSILHISSSSPRLTFTDTDTGADHRINADSGAGNLAFDVDFNSDTASPALIANIKGSEKLRITSTGELKHIGGGSEGSPAVYFAGSAPSNSLVIDSTGKVGLGHSSPDATLNVRAGANNTTAEEIASFSRPDAAVRAAISKGLISGTTNGIAIGTTTNHPFAINTNGTERLYITNAGNVGVNTASPDGSLHVHTASAGTVTPWTNADDLTVENNGATGISIIAPDNNQANLIFGSPSDNIGSIIRWVHDDNELQVGTHTTNGFLTFKTAVGSEAARIDSSGRLLVGTSSSYDSTSVLQLKGASGSYVSQTYVVNNSSNLVSGNGLAYLIFRDALNSGQGAWIGAIADGTWATSPASYPTRLVFSTTAAGASSPTERMRISNNGYSKCANAGSGAYDNATGAYHEFVSDGADNAIRIKNTNATPFGLRITHSTDSNGVGNEFLACFGAATIRAALRSNGGLANFSANNANLSDRNAKKDISLAAGTWDCIKEWEIVNYRYKDQPDDADLNLGVIAQQVAESCPEVITVFEEAKDDQPEKLGVKEQQMYWMAIKALQEAQVRIETLEAEVAALKAQ